MKIQEARKLRVNIGKKIWYSWLGSSRSISASALVLRLIWTVMIVNNTIFEMASHETNFLYIVFRNLNTKATIIILFAYVNLTAIRFQVWRSKTHHTVGTIWEALSNEPLLFFIEKRKWFRQVLRMPTEWLLYKLLLTFS